MVAESLHPGDCATIDSCSEKLMSVGRGTDKRGALVDLGRHLKLFTDKVQVDGELQVEVQDVKQKLLAKLHNRHTMDDVLAGRVEIPKHNAESCIHCKAGSLSQPSQISDNFR